MLSDPVLTGSDGSFSITGTYTCPAASSQLYLIANGGNPGFSSPVDNQRIVLMAALGPCGLYGGNLTLDPNRFVNLNEVTTVAAANALSGFMDPITTQVGTSSTNLTGLANAFTTVNNLVNTVTGQALASTPGGTGIAPQSEIDALANILAPCVNSDGTGSPCSSLFSAATPSGGTAPTNTLQAALSIALHPASQASTLWGLVPATPPFLPTLGSAPAAWVVGLTYTTRTSPFAATSMALDPAGNVWFASSCAGSCALSAFSPTGTVVPTPSFSYPDVIASPHIAFDPSGNLWIAAQDPNLTPKGILFKVPAGSSTLSSFTASGLTTPGYPAIDASGNIWFANSSSSAPALFEFSANGTLLSPATGFTASSLATPTYVAIDNTGNPWVADTSAVTEFNSSGQPLSGTSGYAMSGFGPIAFDNSGNLWNGGVPNKISSAGATLSVPPWCSLGTASPPVCYPATGALAIDGAGNAWGVVEEVARFGGAFTTYYGIQEINSAGTQVFGSIGYMNGTEPNFLAVDASGNLWGASATGSVLNEYVGASTPVAIPSISAAQHTVGTRP